MNEELEALLTRCTVKLFDPESGRSGTGFFVAPGFILTCNHVVSGDPFHASELGKIIQFSYKKDQFKAQVFRSIPGVHDLALLKFDISRGIKDAPCVRLHCEFDLVPEVKSGEELYLFGYPGEGFTNGSPVTGVCEFFTGGEEEYIKFKDGHVQPGMSGSALLNQSTGMVCGLVKLTRDEYANMGGGAVRAKHILGYFPWLKHVQREFHQSDRRWKDAALTNATRIGFKEIKRGSYKLPERDNNEQAILVKSSNEVIHRLTRSLDASVSIDLEMELQPKQVDYSYDTDVLMELQPKQVDAPYDADILIGPQANELLRLGTSIIDVFDRKEISGRLLILGQPGAGKTTELLRLADVLLDRAELTYEKIIHEKKQEFIWDSIPEIAAFLEPWTAKSKKQEYMWHPIPIIFNLASWNLKESIVDWMIRELDLRGIPKNIGRNLIEKRQILPLLDGLDELDVMRQQPCVLELNKYIHQEEPTYLVVCCRQEVYEKLNSKLILNGAISLKDLNPEQIRGYLNEVNQLDFWNQTKDYPKLLNLLRTPFLLSISVVVIKDSEDKLLVEKWKDLKSEKDCITYLLDAYIDRMFNRPLPRFLKSKDLSYTQEPSLNKEANRKQSMTWIKFLAKKMQEDSIAEFLIENIQPNWISKKLRLIYNLISGLYSGALSTLFVYVLMALLFIQFHNFSDIQSKDLGITLSQSIQYAKFFSISVGVVVASIFIFLENDVGIYENNTNMKSSFSKLITSISISLLIANAYYIYFSFLGNPQSTAIAPIVSFFILGISFVFHNTTFNKTTISISPKIILCIKGIMISIFIPFLGTGLILFVFNTGLVSLMVSIFFKLAHGIEIEANIIQDNFSKTGGISFMLFALLLLFLLQIPFLWTTTKEDITMRLLPNQGIKESGRNFFFMYGFSIFFGGIALPVIFPIYKIITKIDGGITSGDLLNYAAFGMLVGVVCGIPGALNSGGISYIKHLSLRSILWWQGLAPGNYAQFLRYTVERRFIQQVGGRY